MRGENSSLKQDSVRISGTSPRARGKPDNYSMHVVHAGNIPACAGKTLRGYPCCCQPPEHPRVRGENPAFANSIPDDVGTSPRARGKLPVTWFPLSNNRNIPACAGKTFATGDQGAWGAEHPRVRGENSNNVAVSGTRIGTSPRARGKRVKKGEKVDFARNIPACAGKTLIDVRFLVPDGHFTFGFVFLHCGGFHGIPLRPAPF